MYTIAKSNQGNQGYSGYQKNVIKQGKCMYKHIFVLNSALIFIVYYFECSGISFKLHVMCSFDNTFKSVLSDQIC